MALCIVWRTTPSSLAASAMEYCLFDTMPLIARYPLASIFSWEQYSFCDLPFRLASQTGRTVFEMAGLRDSAPSVEGSAPGTAARFLLRFPDKLTIATCHFSC